jgi:hypothetical protein
VLKTIYEPKNEKTRLSPKMAVGAEGFAQIEQFPVM